MRLLLAALATIALSSCGAKKDAEPAPQTTQEEFDAAVANVDEEFVDDVLQPPSDEAKTIDDLRAESLAAIDKEACAAVGGEIRQEGMLGMYRCVKPYADAGKECRSGADCEGKCMATGDEATGEEAVGACQANDSPFGCYAEVEDGKVTNALCVD